MDYGCACEMKFEWLLGRDFLLVECPCEDKTKLLYMGIEKEAKEIYEYIKGGLVK